MNITDSLAPFFEGKISWDDAASDAAETFLRVYNSETFICESCGEIVFPKVTTNEHGIFIDSNRTEVRGSRGNRCIKRNVCEECTRRLTI